MTASVAVHEGAALLADVRVLDVSGEIGFLAGKVLADMGADVIKVEQPGGDPARRRGPFYADITDPNYSLPWWAENANKRGVTLDIGTVTGRDIFLRLVEGTDVLIESADPGRMTSLGLSYAELSAARPELIYASVSAYGQEGPHSRYVATDLNIQGMGTHMYLTGDADRPPIRVGIPVAYYHAGVEAAAAITIALYHRARTGTGQAIDVSAQECVIWTLLNTTMTWQMVAREEQRGGAVRKERAATIETRLVWECQDGLVHFVPIGGGGGVSRVKSWHTFVQWMESEGFGHPILLAKDWNGKDMYGITQSEYDALSDQILKFLETKQMSELYERAVTDHLLLAPIAAIPELVDSPQLATRDFYVDVWHPELGLNVKYPGPFAKLSATPLSVRRRAPLVGEHNVEIFSHELGYSSEELQILAESGVI
jgi:crotonobetainyl-CoA:carnitine CoA-transferase CaiB-like acyl-CoA transferase